MVVISDSTPSYLDLDNGDGTFEDVSYMSGYASNGEGREIASMGVAVGDYRNNGLVDLLNTDFSDDYDVLCRNEGDVSFSDLSALVGIVDATVPFLGWGTEFIDYDNDGWKDLFIVNGHAYPSVDETAWGTSFAQRPLPFRNLLGEKLELVPPVRDTGLSVTVSGRGGEDILICWPSGVKGHVKPNIIDRILDVEEGKGIIGELCVACVRKITAQIGTAR